MMRNPFRRRQSTESDDDTPGFTIPAICATCGEAFTQRAHIENVIQLDAQHVNIMCHVDDGWDMQAHQLTHQETK